MKLSQPQPRRRQQKSRKNRPPRGRMLLLMRKSSRSSTQVPAPRGWKSASRLKPRAQGSEQTQMPTACSQVARRRSMPHTSAL